MLWMFFGPAVNHVRNFPVIPEIRTPLIEVNNTALGAQAKENSLGFERKICFVADQILTLSLGHLSRGQQQPLGLPAW